MGTLSDYLLDHVNEQLGHVGGDYLWVRVDEDAEFPSFSEMEVSEPSLNSAAAAWLNPP